MNVFISYSTKDLPNVEALRNQLSLPGVEVFVSQHCEDIGQPLNDSILEQLAKCHLFLLVWSKNADESKYVHQEIGHAKATHKPIFPIAIEEGVPLPGMISDLRYISLTADQPDTVLQIQKLVLQRSEQFRNQQLLLLLILGAAVLILAAKK